MDFCYKNIKLFKLQRHVVLAIQDIINKVVNALNVVQLAKNALVNLSAINALLDSTLIILLFKIKLVFNVLEMDNTSMDSIVEYVL